MPRLRRAVLWALLGAALGTAVRRRAGRGARPAAVPSPARSIPAGRVERAARIARVSGRTGADLAVTRARQVRASDEKRAELEERFHLRTAEQVLETMGEMKGALMKIGQMLSFVDSGLPPAFRDALASLQADAPPMATALVHEAVESELGAPLDALFRSFDDQPLAAASIGQVHGAVLLDGTEVAVKVQYPGVDDAIRSDLDNADLVGAFSMIFPSFEAGPVVEELRERVGEELDYHLEAASQAWFAEVYAGHPAIRVPAVVFSHSSRRVITMERVGGLAWSEALTAPQALRDRWGEIIYRFVFGSLNLHHVFNGDPHPGNYRFHDDGTVTFLDFGCVKRFTEQHMEVQRQMVQAVVHDRPAELRDRLVDLGFLRRDDDGDPQRYLDWFRLWYAPVLAEEPWTYTPEFASEAVRTNFDPTSEWADVQRRFNMPRDIVFLNRINVGLNSILAGLRATAVWRRIAEEYWHDGPPATELGRAEREWRTGRGSATAHWTEHELFTRLDRIRAAEPVRQPRERSK